MLLSVIIPLHNAQATIARAIDSLRDQAVTDLQTIVIDDGSTDDGPALVAAMAARDRRITLISQPNGGVCRARNAGLDAARGEFVLFLDADDWMLPGGVDSLLSTALAAGASAGAIAPFELHSERAGLIGPDGPWSETIGLQQLLGGIFMVTHGHLVPRSVFEGLRFDPALSHIEDTDLWIRLAERGLVWHNTHAPAAAYWIRPTSRSVQFQSMLTCTQDVYRAAYARVRAAQVTGQWATVDASPDRLDRTLGSAAFGYCTRLAISGRDHALRDALAILKAAPGQSAVSSRQAARSAQHAVIFARAARPTLLPAGPDPPWWLDLQAFWQACASEGLIGPDTPAEAAACFRQTPPNSPPSRRPPSLTNANT